MNLIASVAGLIAFAQGGQAGVLTLDEAIRIAEQNAFSVRIGQSEVEESRQRVAEASGALGPRANVGATYLRFDRQATTSFGPGQPIIVTQPIEQKQVTASVSMPIDISGNIRRGVRAARANLRSSEQNLAAERSDLRRDVRRAYFSVLQAEALVAVAQQAVTTAEQALRNAQIEFEAGSKARIDVLRLETLLSQARNDLLISQNARDLAKNAFNNVLARPIQTPVALAEVEALPALPRDADQIVESAVARRPEVRSLEFVRDALANIRRAEERGTNPSLSASMNYQRNIDAQGFSARDQQTTGQLALNFPVFDSGVTRARVRAARQDEEQVRLQLEQVKLGISLEVRQALSNLESARSRLEVATKQVDLAEENLRLAQIRYQAGEGIPLEITDAQEEATRARTQRVNARYEYLAAYAEFQRATGADVAASTNEGGAK